MTCSNNNENNSNKSNITNNRNREESTANSYFNILREENITENIRSYKIPDFRVNERQTPSNQIKSLIQLEDIITKNIDDFVYEDEFENLFKIVKYFKCKYFKKKWYFDYLEKFLEKQIKFSKINWIRNVIAFRVFQLIDLSEEYLKENSDFKLLFLDENIKNSVLKKSVGRYRERRGEFFYKNK